MIYCIWNLPSPCGVLTACPILLSGCVEAGEGDMSCRSCGLGNQRKFAAEMSVHVLGLENVDKPVVWVFPRLLVCMDCGFTELTIAENELHLLGKDPARDLGATG